MNDKEISELVELLYPFFVKKMKTDAYFKNCIRSVNATVTWVDTSTETVNNTSQRVSNKNKAVKIKFPYDTEEISVLNRSNSELDQGDLVCLHYYIDLKNAYVAYKV